MGVLAVVQGTGNKGKGTLYIENFKGIIKLILSNYNHHIMPTSLNNEVIKYSSKR